MSKINPGTDPVPNATEDQAAANLAAFLDAVREHGGTLIAEPQRTPDADTDGRYGWVLPTGTRDGVLVLIPGAPLEQVTALDTTAPCLRVDGNWWWWRDAVRMVAGPLGRTTP